MTAPGAAHPTGDEEPQSLRVLVVAAYPASRAGLSTLLGRDPGLRPFGAAFPVAPGASIGSWREADPPEPPAAIVLDTGGMADGAADDVADAYPGVPLVLLGADPATDGPGLGERPVAYLGPDADAPSLAAAVRAVAAGLTVLDSGLVATMGLHAHPGRVAPVAAGEALTARERQVLELVAAGLPNKAIARELGISEHTAKFHVGSLLGKLGAASRAEAVMLATRRGLLTV